MTVGKYMALQGLDTGNVYHQLHDSFTATYHGRGDIAVKSNGELDISQNADGTYNINFADGTSAANVSEATMNTEMKFSYDRKNHFLRYNDLTAMKEAQTSTGINVDIDSALGTADKVFVQEVMAGRQLYTDGTDMVFDEHGLTHGADALVSKVVIGGSKTEDALRTAYASAQETLQSASREISNKRLQEISGDSHMDLTQALTIIPGSDPTKERYGDIDSALQRRSEALSNEGRTSAEQVARNAMNRRKEEKK